MQRRTKFANSRYNVILRVWLTKGLHSAIEARPIGSRPCPTLIESELQVKMNFDMDSQTFHKFVKRKKQPLRCAEDDTILF